MHILGNIIWLLFGGLPMAFGWFLAGLLWSITIIGIPVGVQCFKIAGFAFMPFGKRIVYGNSTFSFLINLVWIVFSGWLLALGALFSALLLTLTVVGIPFAVQCLKFAKLAFMPFGTRIV